MFESTTHGHDLPKPTVPVNLSNRKSSTAKSICVALLLIVVASNVAYAQTDAALLLAQLPRQQNFALLSMQIFIATWIFVLGSCFGSFLNVVIYRLPAGMSLGKPKSRCPQCETPLAARDNIPVFGWLLLKGKCRFCSLPIAPRYPIIEAICGLIFLTLMFGELLTGGANLPLRHPDHFHVHPGFWLVWFAKWDLSGIFLYHCCMLVVLLATVMISYDGHKPQNKLLAFGVVVGLVCGMMWPELRPVPGFTWPVEWNSYRTGFIWQDLMDPPNRYWTGITFIGALDGLAAVVGGLLFGWLVRFAASAKQNAADTNSRISGSLFHVFVVAAVFLGWQASGMLAILCLPLILAHKLVPGCCPGFWLQRAIGPAVFVATWIFVLAWETLDSSSWMIGFNGWDFGGHVWPLDWLTTIVVFAVACVAVHSVSTISSLAAEPVAVELDHQIDSTNPNTTES